MGEYLNSKAPKGEILSLESVKSAGKFVEKVALLLCPCFPHLLCSFLSFPVSFSLTQHLSKSTQGGYYPYCPDC